ncbi:MAG: cell division protein FtsZ [Bacteroidota bacterium]
MTIKFDSPKESSSIIKVIGVGGGGSNAVNFMYNQGIKGVDFIISNTDQQALETSSIPNKIQLGVSLTDGMGAGSKPEIGRKAALESIDGIKEILQQNTKMVFITAGMGGGTGTGAAPVIAQIAKEMGILTVGIVTIPFSFEGRKRKQQAEQGLEELRKYVDTLLIICNDKLRVLHGDLKLSEAFERADNILTIAAKGIAEIITVTGKINVDFNDVNTVMRDSGAAIMGIGLAEGENRAIKAVELALSSPLLDDSDITGAQNILLYIASGSEEISMDEVSEITDYIQQAAGSTAEIIWGNGNDESLDNKISVTLIATGFNASKNLGYIANSNKISEKTVVPLFNDVETPQTPTHLVVENEMSIFIKEIEVQKISDEVQNINSSEQKNSSEEIPNFNSSPFKETKMEFQVKNEPGEMFIITKSAVNEEPGVNEAVNSINANLSKDTPLPVVTTEVETMALRHRERVIRLREMSQKLKQPDGLNELEKEPAYIRRNVELINTTPSSESEISKLSIGNDDDKKSEFKPNSYLHDNVD